MVAFLLMVACCGIFLVLGLSVNLFLYSRGLFKSGYYRSFSEMSEEDYNSTLISGRYDLSGSYVRKAIIVAVAAVMLLCLFVVTYITAFFH